MADSRPIGVFDSGVGGLTVVKEIMKCLPNENIVYFGDTKRVPYGTKSDETIKKFACEDEAFLLSRDVKLIVAACGTVSAVASDTGDELPVEFIGVVKNAAKAAVAATKNKKIGVIGTVASIKSDAHKKEILKLMPDALVYTAACTLFVPLVEAGWTSSEDLAVNKIVAEYLTPIKESGVDTLILGCTHYPLLSDAIRKIMGEEVSLINMGEATAQYIAKYLEEESLLSSSCDNGKCDIFVSDVTQAFCETASLIFNTEINENGITEVEIEGII